MRLCCTSSIHKHKAQYKIVRVSLVACLLPRDLCLPKIEELDYSTTDLHHNPATTENPSYPPLRTLRGIGSTLPGRRSPSYVPSPSDSRSWLDYAPRHRALSSISRIHRNYFDLRTLLLFRSPSTRRTTAPTKRASRPTRPFRTIYAITTWSQRGR